MIQKAIILNKYFNDKLSLGSNCRIISINLTEVLGKQKDGGTKVSINGHWWWWSRGQHAYLLLRRFEFESHRGLQFLCKMLLEKNKYKQTEAGPKLQ